MSLEQDHAEIIKWYHEAAHQGQAETQNNLGLMYAKGWGVQQDFAEAYKWFSLSASKGVQKASKARQILASQMTPQQIAEGKRRSSIYIVKKRSAA